MFSTKSSGLDSAGAAADNEAQTPAEDRARRGREMDCGKFLNEENGRDNLATAFAAEEVVMEAIKAVVSLGCSIILIIVGISVSISWNWEISRRVPLQYGFAG